MPTPSFDFKAQVVKARRTQILMGAAQVFAEKGFHRATTKEIATAAGISEGTIYNYFSNKRELLVALMEMVGMQSLKNLILDDPPQDPKALFTALMFDRYHLAKERGSLIAPVVAEVFTDVELRESLYQRLVVPITGHLEGYIQDQIDSGRFRKIDPVIVTRAIMGALIFNFVLKLTKLDARYDHISDEALVEQLVSLYVDGLLVDKSEPTDS